MCNAFERVKERQLRGSPPGGKITVLDAVMQPQRATGGNVVQIPMGKLHDFSGHTFKLRSLDDPYMISLLDSIRAHGIKQPLLVRPHPSIPGEYEIIAGHTRHFLGIKAGLPTAPCIVEELDDMTAIIQMGETNINRPDWLPSERAATYKAHLEAIRQLEQHRIGRPKTGEEKKVDPGSTFFDKTRDLAAQRWGIAGKTLERYVKLADLQPDLLQMVDDGLILVKVGYQLAFLPKDTQAYLYVSLKRNPKLKISEAAARDIRYFGADKIDELLELYNTKPPKPPAWNLSIPKSLVLASRAQDYLGDAELQDRIAEVINQYIKEQGSTTKTKKGTN